jgi:hypothetical protein
VVKLKRGIHFLLGKCRHLPPQATISGTLAAILPLLLLCLAFWCAAFAAVDWSARRSAPKLIGLVVSFWFQRRFSFAAFLILNTVSLKQKARAK